MKSKKLVDYPNYIKIAEFYLETRILKIKNLIKVFYNSEKNRFILVDCEADYEENVISPRELFGLYHFNIYKADTSEF